MSVTANFAGPVQTDAINRFRMLQSMAKITQNVGTSATNTTYTTVGFTAAATVQFNTDNIWASANPTRLTAPIAGKYFVYGLVRFNSNGTGDRDGRFRVNGTTPYGEVTTGTATGGSDTIVLVATVIPLSANDYVELQAWQSSGGALNVSACEFGMHYVGE